jgi:hypothetical protein
MTLWLSPGTGRLRSRRSRLRDQRVLPVKLVDAAAAHNRLPAAGAGTEDVRLGVVTGLPSLLARWAPSHPSCDITLPAWPPTTRTTAG